MAFLQTSISLAILDARCTVSLQLMIVNAHLPLSVTASASVFGVRTKKRKKTTDIDFVDLGALPLHLCSFYVS